jgi:hypothetical protein
MDVRFLLDEHIDFAIASALRLRGHDVKTLADVGLLGADDFQDILPLAATEQRILITRDSDFLALHGNGVQHAGIVYWPGRKRNVKQAIHYVLQLARAETIEIMSGEVRYIKDRYP